MPDYRKAARRVARKYGIDPGIFERQIQQESGFNPNAKSGAGAQGIAQFIPSTAKAYGVKLGDGRVTDDLEGAARYMRDNLAKTGGNYHAALSIFNSGKPDAYKDPNFAQGQTYNYVRTILAGRQGNVQGRGTGPGSDTSFRTQTSTTPGVDRSGDRRALLVNYLESGQRHQPDGLLQLKQGLDQSQDTPSRTTTRRVPFSRPAEAGMAGGGVDAVKREAQRINDAHVPYKWGGGHKERQPRGSTVAPVDCSGAVSRVLGINPRVAGQFESWGKPGRGGRVTIYANGHHVLMEIDGHFWGTSAANPGGGAGWIPRSQISAGYLKGFTARHSDRLG